jgi:hypothetical protein
MNLLEKASAYANGVRILKDWVGSGGSVVDQPLAQQRADTCIKCPRNVMGWKAPEKVAEAIRQQLSLKNDMALVVKGEPALQTCEVCLCCNRLKIWCPIVPLTKYMTRDDFSEYPPSCWLRTETNL